MLHKGIGILIIRQNMGFLIITLRVHDLGSVPLVGFENLDL